jgi:hypothetical protein
MNTSKSTAHCASKTTTEHDSERSLDVQIKPGSHLRWKSSSSGNRSRRVSLHLGLLIDITLIVWLVMS